MAAKRNIDTVKEKECFVALFDILGFSELVKTSELDKVATLYMKVRDKLERTARDIKEHLNRNITVRCFSDTFLIYTHSVSDTSFNALIMTIEYLFIAAIKNNLPIRGAVTAGNLLFSQDMELGSPIVEAYRREQKQEWIGCWIATDCTKRITDLSRYLKEGTIVKYKIPLKTGHVRERHALNWVTHSLIDTYVNGDSYEIRKRKLNRAIKDIFNFQREEISDWPIKRKHDNTRKFIQFIMSKHSEKKDS